MTSRASETDIVLLLVGRFQSAVGHSRA
jgi:hypothetical protein